MTPETLLAGGSNKFDDRFQAHRLNDWYRASYQRRIRDEIGTRYFITIAHGIRPSMDDMPERPFFAPDVQFEWRGSTFNADFLWSGESIEQVETFYAALWARMPCGYYEGGPNEERGYPQAKPDTGLPAAARALSDALHACMPAIDGAFAMQAVRGNWYEGPTFGEELKALDAALEAEAAGGGAP